MKKIRTLATWALAISAGSHALLLAILFFFTGHFGGTADLGKIEQGRYFVGQHGGFVEVPRAVYLFSVWHMNILVANLFILAITGGVFWFSSKRGT